MPDPDGDTSTAILRSLERRERDRQPPPTIRELADDVGVAAVATVKKHLARLEAQGVVGRLHEGEGRARSLAILGPRDVCPTCDCQMTVGATLARRSS